MPKAKRRQVGQWAYTIVALLALIQGGCLLVAAGAAAGGAVAGYAYWRGRLYRDYPASITDSLAAVHTALLELQFPILREDPGATSAQINSRTTDGSTVRIYLDVMASRIPADGPLTRISIRVGAFGDEATSARLLDQISMHLAQPGQLPATANLRPQALPPIQPVSATHLPETSPPPLAVPEPIKPK
jgi:hypothetical protein